MRDKLSHGAPATGGRVWGEVNLRDLELPRLVDRQHRSEVMRIPPHVIEVRQGVRELPRRKLLASAGLLGERGVGVEEG